MKLDSSGRSGGMVLGKLDMIRLDMKVFTTGVPSSISVTDSPGTQIRSDHRRKLDQYKILHPDFFPSLLGHV